MAGAKSEIHPLHGARACASSCNAKSRGKTTPQTDSTVGGSPLRQIAGGGLKSELLVPERSIPQGPGARPLQICVLTWEVGKL